MAAPDFPAAPTVGQTYTAPSGNIYKWDGAVWQTSSVAPLNAYWTDTGTALTPTATRQVVVSGSSANPATPSQAQMVLGTRTTKMRLQSLAGFKWDGITSNGRYDGTNWVADDSTQPSWNLVLHPDTSADTLNVEHAAAGSNMAFTLPLQIAGDGTTTLTVPSSESGVTINGTGPSILLNGSQRNGIWYGDTSGTRWFVGMDGAATSGIRGTFRIYNNVSSGGNVFSVDAPSGKTTCTLADGTVTKPMLAAQSTVRNFTSAPLPANWSSLTLNTWLQLAVTGAVNWGTGYKLMTCHFNGYITANPTGGGIYFGFFRDGTAYVSFDYILKSPTTANVQVTPPTIMWWDTTSGSHTYGAGVYQTGNALYISGANVGYLMVTEFC